MTVPAVVPPRGQRGTLIIRNVTVDEIDPSAVTGAVNVTLSIGDSGDSVVVDIHNPDVTLEPEIPEHWPPAMAGEIWRGRNKALFTVVIRGYDGLMVMVPLKAPPDPMDLSRSIHRPENVLAVHGPLTRLTEGTWVEL